MEVICFDLEGPLSPQDNAYELMSLIENGEKIFEVISRYDDILALEGREDYEPGDTLSLIAPFLVYHSISEYDIRRVSDRAVLVDGAREFISKLMFEGWRVYIISTSYEQHAYNIGRRLGIAKENIYCTSFPLDKYQNELGKEEFRVIERAEKDILKLYPPKDDEKLKSILDRFFFDEILRTELGRVIEDMSVVGGERKVKAVKDVADENDKDLSEIIVIGDSITDFKMLQSVRERKGIAVVFNGNEYAVPYANVGLAGTDMRFMQVVTDAWSKGRRESVIEAVKSWEKGIESVSSKLVPDELKTIVNEGAKACFHYLEGDVDLESVIRVHKEFRKAIRGEAAKLG